MPETEAEAQSFMPFKDLNDVPKEVALHQGARLTLEQVNELIPKAYALGSPDLPNMGEAWAEFRASHHIENTIWVAGNGDLT
jgi:hypothetical protein